MNAAPDVQLRLLDLQTLDAALDRLAHRRRTLPELADIERLDGRLTELYREIVQVETAVSDLAREQSRVENDVDMVRARMTRDQQRLDSGQVGSPRELENLQHEVASLSRRQGALEDQALEVMERRETGETRLAALRAEQAELQTQRESATVRRDASYAEIDTDADRSRQQRADLAAELPADLLTLYEKIRASSGGVGAAALFRGRCEGCRLSLSPIDISAMKAAPADAVQRCEECRRILVRTPDSGL